MEWNTVSILSFFTGTSSKTERFHLCYVSAPAVVFEVKTCSIVTRMNSHAFLYKKRINP